MISAEIEQHIREIIADLGYELWACEYIPQGKHSLLRVYIDTAGGIMIDDCEKVSRAISAYLDVEEPIKGNYSLEVSSPGIPRPLFTLDHFKQYLQHQVEIKLIRPLNASRKISGEIDDVKDDGTIIVRLGEESQEVPFSLIVKAYLTGE